MKKEPFTVEMLLRDYPPPIREIANRLREVIGTAAPDANEKANRGWRSINYRDPQLGYFCGIFPFTAHVDLMFEFGVLLPDPDRLLNGDKKQVRYVRVNRADDIPEQPLAGLIAAALALPPDHTMRRALVKAKQTAG